MKRHAALTIGNVGDISRHGNDSLRIGPDAFTAEANRNAMPIVWAHDEGAYLGHSIGFTITPTGIAEWVVEIDLEELARHTGRPLETLGVSPTVDLRTCVWLETIGTWGITSRTRVHHLAITDRPAFANTRIRDRGPAPARPTAPASLGRNPALIDATRSRINTPSPGFVTGRFTFAEAAKETNSLGNPTPRALRAATMADRIRRFEAGQHVPGWSPPQRTARR